MILIVALILLLLILLYYLNPWLDRYVDYRGEKHIVLWYTNFLGKRSYIEIKGSQN